MISRRGVAKEGATQSGDTTLTSCVKYIVLREFEKVNVDKWEKLKVKIQKAEVRKDLVIVDMTLYSI